MLRSFSSICIGGTVVFLSQQKSWRKERELVDKNRSLLKRTSLRDACGYYRLRPGTPPLGVAGGMVMATMMTQGLRYLSFRCTIKEFMLRVFS